ncbi:hypothetical protein KFU94_01640 [Chloroflexi bacterium TSY]|nr:hypothetical protein [Chloroflexi bacterium TSY]
MGNLNGTTIRPALANGYRQNAFGIRRFRFYVEKETDLIKPDPVPHLFAWKMWGQLVGDSLVDPEINGQAFFAHSNNGLTNLGHQGHVDIGLDLITVQFEVGLKKACKWEETHTFGNNTGNGVEERTRSGVIEKKGELSCL